MAMEYVSGELRRNARDMCAQSLSGAWSVVNEEEIEISRLR